jgi:hypothetical protein
MGSAVLLDLVSSVLARLLLRQLVEYVGKGTVQVHFVHRRCLARPLFLVSWLVGLGVSSFSELSVGVVIPSGGGEYRAVCLLWWGVHELGGHLT